MSASLNLNCRHNTLERIQLGSVADRRRLPANEARKVLSRKLAV